jgi:phospholipid-binding lipoprotein MlaA
MNLIRQGGKCLVLLLAVCSVGCASVEGQGKLAIDPFETTNRRVSAFNEQLDQNLVKPVATTYQQSVPGFIQDGVHNFFGNLGDIWSTANNALQLKPMETAETGLRTAINTVFGVYGLIDWGSRLGLQRHNADFGQTLGYWGVPSGPYIVLPLLGPSNVRDTVGLVVDAQENKWAQVTPDAARYSGTAVRVVDKRAEFLGMDKQLDEVALDKYSFIRDAYVQRRLAQTRRGNPTADDGDDNKGGGDSERFDQ